MQAHPRQVEGKWGVSVECKTAPEIGSIVEVVTRDGKTFQKKIVRVVSHEKGVAICEVASLPRVKE